MLDTANSLGKAHVILPNTTLNEKFSVFTSASTLINPVLQYYTIGLNYEQFIQGTSINIDNVRHKPTDGALFKHAPFIARPLDSDLTDAERLDYRLRVETFIEGVGYAFYYIKKIDNISTTGKLLYVTNDLNETFLSLFSTEVDHILTPIVEERDKVDDSLIDYIAYSHHATISMTDNDLDELYRAVRLLYGEDTDVILGELGLVSGHETTDDVGRIEIANAQIGYFLKIDHILSDINLNNKFIKTIELGGMSPMVFRTYR